MEKEQVQDLHLSVGRVTGNQATPHYFDISDRG